METFGLTPSKKDSLESLKRHSLMICAWCGWYCMRYVCVCMCVCMCMCVCVCVMCVCEVCCVGVVVCGWCVCAPRQSPGGASECLTTSPDQEPKRRANLGRLG